MNEAFEGWLLKELESLSKAGLRRSMKVMDRETGPDALGMAVLSSNDYLDLASDLRVKEAAAKAAMDWGAGSGGSRLTTGTQPPHVALENHIASFKGAEAAISFATGYMANVGTIQALAGKGDIIFSDALNHASIIDGCRLSGAAVTVYRHLDMEDLESKLSAAPQSGRRLVVSDGVFSMDGDILDLPSFVSVCRRWGAVSFVDEAHATGVIGQTGRGLHELYGGSMADVTSGTFSKALGSSGGFICGSKRLCDYLVNRARSFIFSTAPGAAAAAAADAAIGIVESEPWRVVDLAGNVAYFVGRLAEEGVATSTQSAIVPIPVGDEKRAVEISESLAAKGFLIPAIRYPTVPRSESRLRAAIMSSHSKEMLSLAASVIAAQISPRAVPIRHAGI